MKILVLTFYYEPDLCAGSFRTTPLVTELLRQMPADSHIDVVTTLPNRYRSFTTDAAHTEQKPGLSVYRIALPNHKSGMLDQSRSFMTFAREAVKKVEGQEYNLVFATSSRLMTAVLGAWIAKQKKARLYLDIRDIFVDTIKDVLPKKIALLAKPIFSLLEKWAVTRANKLNLVSAGFAGYFSGRYPYQDFSYFTNGIDDEFIAFAPVQSSIGESKKNSAVTVLYAGNLGEGQGLHAIIPNLAMRMGPRYNFKIIGDGGRKQALEFALTDLGVTNVELVPPMKREELLRAYNEADVLFLHLNDYDAFKKVLPSKIFEYAALGKPIWAGVAGYSAEFLRSEVVNCAVFRPCDIEDAVQVFKSLLLQNTPRPEFIKKYERKVISCSLAEDILSVGRENA